MYDKPELGPVRVRTPPSWTPLLRLLRSNRGGATIVWTETDAESPLIVAMDNDLRMILGNLIDGCAETDVIAVDGVDLSKFGFLDNRESLEETGALPLAIKSFVFYQ